MSWDIESNDAPLAGCLLYMEFSTSVVALISVTRWRKQAFFLLFCCFPFSFLPFLPCSFGVLGCLGLCLLAITDNRY